MLAGDGSLINCADFKMVYVASLCIEPYESMEKISTDVSPGSNWLKENGEKTYMKILFCHFPGAIW